MFLFLRCFSLSLLPPFFLSNQYKHILKNNKRQNTNELLCFYMLTLNSCAHLRGGSNQQLEDHNSNSSELMNGLCLQPGSNLRWSIAMCPMETWAKDLSSLSLSFPKRNVKGPSLGAFKQCRLPKMAEAFVMAWLGAPVSPQERLWAPWKRGH